MTDKPIIFSAPMVRALLDGRKTQTRRLIKWQGPRGYPHSFDHARVDNPAGVQRLLVPFHHPDEPDEWEACTMHRHYGPADPGDRLYVRETWSARMTHGWTIADARSGLYQTELLYRADGHESIDGWWSSIHMPREFSRLTLTVTEVRVQRLQEINEADAVAEGAMFHDGRPTGHHGWRHDFKNVFPTAKDSFQALWNSLHGPNAWDANPWVVALTFTVQHGNIDAVKPNA